MSLNQKYTWKDFLREHPEHKEKKTKRTSSEGKKAFEAAFKAYIKKYLAAQVERFGKQIAKAEEGSKKSPPRCATCARQRSGPRRSSYRRRPAATTQPSPA